MDISIIAYERYSAFSRSKVSQNEIYKSELLQSFEESSASFVVIVNTKTLNNTSRCSLCSKLDSMESNHPIFRSPRFDSPKIKIDNLIN